MRTLTLALVAGFALPFSAVQAADLDYGLLRGPDYETEVADIDWSGVYVGAHAGYASTSQAYTNKFSRLSTDYFARSNEDFGFANAVDSAAGSLAVFERRVSGTGFGGYLGYNYQFDETVVGVEFDYTRLNAAGRSEYAVNTGFFDGSLTPVQVRVNGIASTEIVDYGTARLRGGFTFGSLMPFLTAGVAIGRAKVGQQIAVTSQNPAYNRVISDRNVDGTTTNAFLGSYVKTVTVGGLALGAGVEWALTQNFILRGEYQYVLFDAFGGTTGSNASARGVNINTVRAGAAIKF